MKNLKKKLLIKDTETILISVAVALIILKTNILSDIIVSTKSAMLGSFIAGIFFTSAFTTAPAIVALGQIAQMQSLFLTALLGGLGAVLGDLLIFRFLRDKLGEHLAELIKEKGYGRRIKTLFKLKLFRWLTFLVGGFIIASPLPDELGIGLMGFAKMKTTTFIVISFVFNFLGIVVIGLLARAL